MNGMTPRMEPIPRAWLSLDLKVKILQGVSSWKKKFAQKIEKNVKFNRPKGFFIMRIYSIFLPIFKTLKNRISEKKIKMYMKESVENILN